MAKKLTRKEKIALQQNEQQSENPIEKKVSPKKIVENKTLLNNLTLLLGILAFFLYANTLNHQYALDDYSVIKENTITKKGFDGLKEIFTTTYRTGYIADDKDLYRPLSKAMFAVEWGIWGEKPFYSHLINVLFYSFTAMLLFVTLHLYFKNLLLSFVSVLLFVFHPLHTEVVANIKSRDEIMCLFLFVAALYFVYRYLNENKITWLLPAVVLYFFSLMSKESAITFIAIVPLTIYFFTDKPTEKNVMATVAFILPAGIFMFIRSKFIEPAGLVAVADNMLSSLPAAEQKATAVYILGKYLLLHIFPHPLVSDYSFRQIQVVTYSDWKFLVSALVFLAMLYFAVKTLKQKNPIGFGILFFFITASVASNIFRIIGTSFGERLMYAPSLGICIALAALAAHFLSSENIRANTISDFLKLNIKVFAPVTVLLTLFSFKTLTRNADWYDNISLYSTDVELSPNSTRTHFYLGNHLSQDEYLNTIDEKDKPAILDSALKELKRSVEILPSFGDAWQQIGKVLLTKANKSKAEKDTVAMTKLYREAEDAYKKALAINPQHAMYNNNYGNVLFNMGRLGEAEKCFSTAVKYNPIYAHAYNNLACVYGTYGEIFKSQNKKDDAVKNFNSAIFYFKKAAEVDPSYISTYKFISITYQSLGDGNNAKIYMDKYKAAGGM
jgi:tetratricopeptide (TPR) repeat protein